MAVTVAPNNSFWRYSPYSWSVTSGSAKANAGGARAQIGFTGTSFTLQLDKTGVASGKEIVLKYSVDNGPWTTYSYNSASSNLTVSGLASGSHQLEIFYYGGWWENTGGTAADRWTGSYMLIITALLVDDGASAIAVSKATRPKNMIFFGDSITEGIRVNNGTAQPGCQNAMQTIPQMIAAALDAECGQIGYGGTSWAGGFNQIPAANSFYANYFSGASRLVGGKFSPMPDYVCSMFGSNGGSSAEAQAHIAALRGASNATTPIFMIVPPGGIGRAAVQAGVASYQQASPSDLFVYIIDVGTQLNAGLLTFGSASQQAVDSLHPTAEHNAMIAPVIAAKILAASGASGARQFRRML
jgi:hypothetical protein